MRNIRTLYTIEGINDRDIHVYRYLCDRINKEGICWPGINTIARDLNRSRSTIKRAIRELRALGLIETEQRYRPNGGKTSLKYKVIGLEGFIKGDK